MAISEKVEIIRQGEKIINARFKRPDVGYVMKEEDLTDLPVEVLEIFAGHTQAALRNMNPLPLDLWNASPQDNRRVIDEQNLIKEAARKLGGDALSKVEYTIDGVNHLFNEKAKYM